MPRPDLDPIRTAAELATAYIAGAAQRSVSPPPEALAALPRFDGPLPEDGIDPSDVLALLDEVGSPATMVSTGGRYFGFVNGGALPAAVAAHVLATAWDQNVALPAMSPVGAMIDAVAARWVTELVDLPEHSVAAFCSGASVANLICIIAARDAVLAAHGWDAQRRGLVGAPPVDIVAGTETHVSVIKALGAVGLGRDSVTWVPTDRYGRIDAGAVAAAISDRPTIVLSQAGNVDTGYSDPFRSIAEACNGRAWLHVDGAFGLWAAASPARSHLVDGVALADSWSTDGHKWPNLPYDCGVAICARGEDLRRAMAADAAYLGEEAGRAPMHLGLQMSQRLRAVDMYAAIATLGRRGIAALVDRLCDRAAEFAARLAAGGAEILVPPVLNQVLVAFGDDAVTDAVVAAVQSGGVLWAGGTTWYGRRAMRLSVSSWATTADDVIVASDAILRTWAAID